MNEKFSVDPRWGISFSLLMTSLCLLPDVAWAESSDSALNQGLWFSVIPPLLAIALAFFTKNLILSLAVSIGIGAFLSSYYESLQGVVKGIGEEASSWIVSGFIGFFETLWGSATDTINLQILAFVFFMLAMISLMIVGGGLRGVIEFLSKYAKSSRSSQIVTVMLGFLVFIDDYANTMIIGNSMRPMSDRYRVSREKLAFLVDATSAPIAGLAVISTWIGYEVGLFSSVSESLSLGKDGYSIFFDAIGFRFYCWFMLVFVLFNAISGRDWGPMRKAQKRALEKGELLSPGSEPMTSQSFSSLDPHPRVRYKAIGALLPILFLFVFLLTGIWRDGLSSMEEVTAQMSVFSFSDWRAVISASENSILLLAYAAVLGWVVAYFLAMLVGKLPFKQGLKASYLGLKAALLPAAILILAWSLKSICDQLETGPFLVNAVSDQIPPVLFPAIVFVLGGIVAFATGTSWGTMAILIPTAVPMAFALDGDVYGLLTIMTFGAILDGAILGDHCSPISDTTLMSSIASSCDHMDHVKTQMPYALWVGSIALLIGYLPAAAGYASWPAFFVGVALMLGGFWLFSQREEAQGPVEEKKKARPASQNT